MFRPLQWLAVCALVAFGLSAPAADEKSEVKLSKEEQAVHDLINAARAKEKLHALQPNGLLAEAARAHAANMAKQRKLGHELDGIGPAQRVKDVGYKYRNSGENVAMTQRLNPQLAVTNWMNSPPHKANILSDKYEESGLGLARDAKGVYYYCQVFGTQKK